MHTLYTLPTLYFAYFCLLLHTFAYFCILLHTFAYFCIFLHTFAYFCILLHTFAYFCIFLHTIAYFCILLHTFAYFCIVLHTFAELLYKSLKFVIVGWWVTALDFKSNVQSLIPSVGPSRLLSSHIVKLSQAQLCSFPRGNRSAGALVVWDACHDNNPACSCTCKGHREVSARKYGHISEWVAGDVSSKRHVCHHVYPGRGMIKTMTKTFTKLWQISSLALSICHFCTLQLWHFKTLQICIFATLNLFVFGTM